mgnify:CR=1 FL=1
MLRHADRFAGLLHSSRVSRSGKHRRSRICFGKSIPDKEKTNPVPERNALTVR